MEIEKKNGFGDKILLFIRIGIAVLSVFWLVLIFSRLVYPFGAGAWESFNWMPAEHLWEGKNPFAFAFKPPFGMSPYGIVFYALTGIGVKLFGYQLWFGRILSILAFAVCLWAIVSIVRCLAKSSKEAIWLAVLIGLAMLPAQNWISLMRPDLIAAAFAFLALALVFALEEDKKTPRWRVGAMILLSSAAFFTKQTYPLLVGIIFLRFLQLKKWREAAVFALGFAVLVSGTMFLLNYTSDGGYIWQHFTHAQRLPFSLVQSFAVFGELFKQPSFFFALVCLIIFAFQRRRGFKNLNRTEAVKIACSTRTLIFFHLLLSLVWSFFSAGRIGGNINYYIENSLVSAIACAIVLADFLRKDNLPKLAAAMVILFSLGGAFQITRVLRGEYFRWQSLNYYREVFETVGKVVPQGSKCVSVYPELVVWNGCAFNFDDFEEYDGTWSPELIEIFEREIRAGNYAAIVWYDDKFSERFPNYHLLKMSQNPPEKYFPVYLFVPRKTP